MPPWFLAWLTGAHSAMVIDAIQASEWEMVPTSLVQAACIVQPFKKMQKIAPFWVISQNMENILINPMGFPFCLFAGCFRNRFEMMFFWEAPANCWLLWSQQSLSEADVFSTSL